MQQAIDIEGERSEFWNFSESQEYEEIYKGIMKDLWRNNMKDIWRNMRECKENMKKYLYEGIMDNMKKIYEGRNMWEIRRTLPMIWLVGFRLGVLQRKDMKHVRRCRKYEMKEDDLFFLFFWHEIWRNVNKIWRIVWKKHWLYTVNEQVKLNS